MGQIFDALVKLLAPDSRLHRRGSLGTRRSAKGAFTSRASPKVNPKYAGTEATEKVAKLLEVKAVMQTAIEEKVQAKEFKKNNEASVLLSVPANHPSLDLLKDLRVRHRVLSS